MEREQRELFRKFGNERHTGPDGADPYEFVFPLPCPSVPLSLTESSIDTTTTGASVTANATASVTTAASRNMHTRTNLTATYGGSRPVAAAVVVVAAGAAAAGEDPSLGIRVVGEARPRAEGGRIEERIEGREVAVPQLRAWERYGENFFYYLSGVE